MYHPGDLRVEEVPIPKIKENEVLLKVMACGVCGSDIPRVNKYGAHIAPLTIGHEFSAQIMEAGKYVKAFKVGDRVTVPPLMPCNRCEWCQKGLYSLCEDYDYFGSRRDGAMAEYLACPEPNLLKIPDNLGYLEAATTDPCANAVHSLLLGDVKENDTVCVFGTGPIGLFAIQCAKAFGAKKVIGVDLSEEKLDVARQCGVDYAINSKTADVQAEIARLTDGKMAQVLLDYTGVPVVQKLAIDCAGKTARIVFVGISHKGLELDDKQVDKIMRGQLMLRGSWNSFSSPFPGDDWFISLKLFAEKKVTGKPMISHKLPLDDAPAIFKKIDQGGFFFNKILFLPHGEIAE
jgi:L-iditol 2-dehydrogenase